ncbi:MAG: glucose-1-phosphate adenylyltransferase subunit GlgD [Oscillospiraceae bacterium]|nr:glucose-1-phosphate adenylyltransferase subunit GlgD [Oscillospiraceae bacterium]
MNNLHGIIFAYGETPDLRELSQPRNSCSLPYGGRFRLIDFALSSLVNAGVTDVGIIVHSSYQSLLDHVGAGKDWDLARKRGGLRILPPFGYASKGRQNNLYRGRMDALAGVYSYLEDIRQDYVILADGDMVANLPVEEAFEQHLRSGADITSFSVPSSIASSTNTNYFQLDKEGWVTDILVRPNSVPEGCAVSLGAYILSKELLMKLVDYCAAHDLYSFSEGVLLGEAGKGLKLMSYAYEGYAASIKSVRSYYIRSMELLDPAVRASLFRSDRPIRTKEQDTPATKFSDDAKVVNSLIADGCVIEGTVINSVVARGVHIAKGAVVENCILLQHTEVQEGATLKYTITDKSVKICSGRSLAGHETYPLVIAKNEVV